MSESNRVFQIDLRRDYRSRCFPVRPFPEKRWRNGLLVRMPNHLGDAVMAIPALMQLKKLLPKECALAVAAPDSLAALFLALPEVDGVFRIARLHCRWDKEVFSEVRRSRFGAAVLFNNSLRDVMTLKLAGIPRLYGAAARGRSLLLKRAFRFARRPKTGLAREHLACRYLAIARALGAPEWDGSLPRFELPVRPEECRGALPGFCAHPMLLTLGAGAAYGAAKRWPSEHFRAVAKWWIDRGGVVAVAGGESEALDCTAVVAGLPKERAVNLAGKTSLAELMVLLQSSRAVVANDSGVMHLAAILGRPGVAVFGSTDFTATGPVNPRWRLLYVQAPCSPCFKHACPGGAAPCLKLITPDEVIAQLTAVCAEARYEI